MQTKKKVTSATSFSAECAGPHGAKLSLAHGICFHKKILNDRFWARTENKVSRLFTLTEPVTYKGLYWPAPLKYTPAQMA